MVDKVLSDCGSELVLKIYNQLTVNEFREFKSNFIYVDSLRSNVIVDFSNTHYLDCSALGMVLILQDLVSSVKGYLSIVFPETDNKAYQILRAANFHKSFHAVNA